jgi:diadenosine tetraphosphate (Ap4A) HIT family hydrolase
MNLASLGNQVPHLHWHVIPRFEDDAHFPDPVWAVRKRAGSPHSVESEKLIEALYARLGGRRTGR